MRPVVSCTIRPAIATPTPQSPISLSSSPISRRVARALADTARLMERPRAASAFLMSGTYVGYTMRLLEVLLGTHPRGIRKERRGVRVLPGDRHRRSRPGTYVSPYLRCLLL